ncbi:putative 3-(3-hydroxy-phenyl)propionate/3-hydroxycinnamic acid hydroxylase [Glarea lozoyensis 74030]|uniref:Putative 3-(3-hydroxy-phenyl)propionate/3-hydroxycinnamic acid hydroxylase n=1 Tax=Glarea lozoyensis (strain ATCC 74030 / MF5533) TaxID=1104152 RepID=H0EEL4_GLAL7|nr:putative 3-(3-hydroxy-phenyl)propionate/3-hydroxycinnamic acid hydroxylase [Glarea lozoyensis 74030]
MAQNTGLKQVIIVGAGPSGLILGILLAKAGIHVLLLEQSAELDTNPRAAHYAPSTVRELRRCGLLKEVQEAGYMPQGVCWRTPEGGILAGISPDPSYEDAMIYYDFHKFGYWDSQFILHPQNWYLAAKITLDGLWRVTYGDIPGLTNEEYLERNAQRFAEILPGKPKPEDYKIANISPYKLHQRCVPSMRVGRVLLAADAAHLCNPFGGLGLTGGIADISSLFDCLLAIHERHADDSILDKWSEVRIRKWREIIDPMSRANFRRLWDNEVLEERDRFFDMCRRITQGGEGRQAYRAATYILDEDMSKYFKK